MYKKSFFDIPLTYMLLIVTICSVAACYIAECLYNGDLSPIWLALYVTGAYAVCKWTKLL